MSTALRTIDLSLPIGSLEVYIQRLYQMPMLTAEEEYALAKRFQNEGDIEAARQLVLSHLRFVAKVAKSYMGYGLALSDLIQEGTVGLMKAVKKFDPDMGVRLVSFAVHWIKSEIHEFVLKNWRIVKIATTKAQRKLFFNLRKTKQRLGWFTKEEINDVATALNVKPAAVIEMEKRLNDYDAAFDALDSEDYSAPVNVLSDQSANPEKIVESNNFESNQQALMMEAFTKLDERSQKILKTRWLTESKATLKELAETYKVSVERIRQIEEAAMQKIREYITANS